MSDTFILGAQLLVLSLGLSTINRSLQDIRHELIVLNRSRSNANVQTSGSLTKRGPANPSPCDHKRSLSTLQQQQRQTPCASQPDKLVQAGKLDAKEFQDIRALRPDTYAALAALRLLDWQAVHLLCCSTCSGAFVCHVKNVTKCLHTQWVMICRVCLM